MISFKDLKGPGLVTIEPIKKPNLDFLKLAPTPVPTHIPPIRICRVAPLLVAMYPGIVDLPMPIVTPETENLVMKQTYEALANMKNYLLGV